MAAGVSYRITVDTGGTFTDVVLADETGRFFIGKSPTTEHAFEGVSAAIGSIAEQIGRSFAEVIASTGVFIYSTTRATNAILQGRTATTALLTTQGFPDTLVLREGGKLGLFDLRVKYPDPYIPRRLTFEVPERIDAQGHVVKALDEEAVRATLRRFPALGIEAVAVCLLSSYVNAAHERRIGELLAEELDGTPFTLSSEINPIPREYRRASSAAIDASLKPLMAAFLRQLAAALRDAGFRGELMAATSSGGVVPVEDLAERPLLSLRSGPSMAPVAGLVYSAEELDADQVIVCDTGGTSFDVSLIRDGAISFTHETWLGPRFMGHLTGASSVDIRSIGAGGGSIAWVDSGGLLHVGPQSAGATPGPACYGRGGTKPTVTDAAMVLGYIDPDGFLGGRMGLDEEAARRVVGELGSALGLSAEETAHAVLAVFSELMVGAIQEITVAEGVDPRESLLVAGGGASGLAVAHLSRELGCRGVLLPKTAGVLSASGGQFSDIVAEFSASRFTSTRAFDSDGVNATLDELDARVSEFADRLRAKGVSRVVSDCFVDARYGYQVWLLETKVPVSRFAGESDIAALTDAFHDTHERVFAVREPGATIECQTWKLRMRAEYGAADVHSSVGVIRSANGRPRPRTHRTAFFDGEHLETPVYLGETLAAGTRLDGPIIVEEPTSTIVVPPGTALRVSDAGNYHLTG
jgi:N-methylhydantoinase A